MNVIAPIVALDLFWPTFEFQPNILNHWFTLIKVSVALLCFLTFSVSLFLAAPELQCDFEDGLCNWKQETEGGDNFDWTHINGPTPTFDTGPFKDHTLGSSYGHYLYIESSSPQEFKDTAVLLSPVFKPTYQPRKDHCVFRFHYCMFGHHVFSLAVYLRTTATGRGPLLWAKYGNQGNLWHRKTLYLHSAQPFQVTGQTEEFIYFRFYSKKFRLNII